MQTSEIIHELSQHTEVQAGEQARLDEILTLVNEYLDKRSLTVTKERYVAIASHLLAFVRRVENREFLDDKDLAMSSEIDARLIEDSRNLLQTYCANRNYSITDTEAFLLAIHFAVCKQGC